MELIKLTKNEQGIETVNARDLHEFLEVKSKFADWFKNRVSEFGFIENSDFVSVSKILESFLSCLCGSELKGSVVRKVVVGAFGKKIAEIQVTTPQAFK